MEPPSAVLSELYKQAQVPLSSNQKGNNATDPVAFKRDVNDQVTQQSYEATGESPGTKALRENELFNQSHPAQVTPTKASAKVLERPNSSGDNAAAPPHYQMPAANFRPPQVKRPNVLSLPLSTVPTILSASLEINEPSPSDVPIEKPEVKLAKRTTTSNRPDPPKPEVSKKHFERPATRGKDATAGPGQDEGVWQAHQKGENSAFKRHSANLVARPDVQVLADVEQSRVSFSFAPAKLLSEKFPPATQGPSTRPQPSVRTGQVSAVGLSREIGAIHQETVLPSIEVHGMRPDESMIEQPSQRVVLHEALTPQSQSNAQMPLPAPRAQWKSSVLEGRIVKPPRPNMRTRKPTPQRQPRAAAVDVSQPTEEDLCFLLMSRSREAKNRERAMKATHEKLQAQLHRVREQNGTFYQQLTTADARSARQNAEITAYKSQIDDFKSRFTKFKNYARDMAQDYTDMGKAMKHIGNTTNELIKDKADINHSLESLRNSSAHTSGLLAGLRPKITAAAQALGPLQNALQLAEAKVQMTDANLQHEQLRNNRIESQMLSSQQVQERIRLSSVQEYRKAAGYLDDLCQATIQLSTTVTKKQQSKDSPGVVECLNLLQTLAEKQGTGITTLTEVKALVGMVPERLLSYHTSAEEATKTAASLGGKLSKDVVSQIATSLASLGPSLGTEVKFATLRERAANLQNQITMGTQMIKLAYDGKNASEQREKEQAVRFDKLIEQVAEATNRQAPLSHTTPLPNPGIDVALVIDKYLRAGGDLIAEQSKVGQKDGELQNKSTETVSLNEKLKSLQTKFEASQVRLTACQEQEQILRGQADAAIQENIVLKRQLENLESASPQAARVPGLVDDLAAKDAELAQLRPQAVKVDELVQIITGKNTELKQLRLEAAKVPALVENLTGEHTEINQLRVEAEKVPKLEQELVKLRDTASAMSQLKEKVASTEAQLTNLRAKADQFEAKSAFNIVLQSNIHDYKNTIQLLEQQLVSLNAQLGPIKQTASEVMELHKRNTALETEATSVKQIIQSLRNEIMALQIKWGDYDQLKKDLTAQKDIHTKEVAHIAELKSKLEEAKARCGQVSDLEGQVDELSLKCGSLYQQLSDATKAAERVHIFRNGRPSHGHETKIRDSQEDARISTKDTNSTRKIPDSQPRASRQSLVVSSSPLSDSNSMLLEDFEMMEGMLKESRGGSQDDLPFSQRQSYGDASSRTVLIPEGSGTRQLQSGVPSQVIEETQARGERTSSWNIVPSSRATVTDQGTRPGTRITSGISSQAIEETQSQEQRPSTPNIVSSSPAGLMRHLPNSGVKRPRLDPIEATPLARPISSKRLRRIPANVEVRSKSRRPASSGTQVTESEPDSACPAQVSLPSGSRKGSVIGANAPVPGKARGSRKTSRKGSKSDHYSERFSNE